jgi:hypothetical protein
MTLWRQRRRWLVPYILSVLALAKLCSYARPDQPWRGCCLDCAAQQGGAAQLSRRCPRTAQPRAQQGGPGRPRHTSGQRAVVPCFECWHECWCRSSGNGMKSTIQLTHTQSLYPAGVCCPLATWTRLACERMDSVSQSLSHTTVS